MYKVSKYMMHTLSHLFLNNIIILSAFWACASEFLPVGFEEFFIFKHPCPLIVAAHTHYLGMNDYDYSQRKLIMIMITCSMN